ncbi:MAG: response regulator transcription factor [Oscillospiraceae bacterium]
MTGRGFSVDTANDGLTGLEYAKTDVYDLVILDVMMPGLDGYTVASRLRAEHHAVPILMLTAKSDLMDRVAGLNAGADYYLTKPFDSRELLACVGALLRRQGEQVDELTFGNTALDLSAGMLRCGSKSVRLSAREFDVMRILLQAKGGNVSKETLLERVWGFDSNAVENHGGLRRLPAEKAREHWLERPHRGHPAAGLSSGGGGGMIRKLRVKLVCILMALLTVMLGVTFGLVLHFTQQSLEAESLRTLEALANNWQTASSPGLDDGTRVPYFALEINARGDIITTRGGYFDLSDREKLQKLIDMPEFRGRHR